MADLHQAEEIAARVQAVLLAAGTDAGDRVDSDREEAFAREEATSIVVELVNDLSQPHGQGMDSNELTFAVISLTRSANWRTVVNTLRKQAHAALVGDAQLAQLLPGLRRTRAEWRAASADLPFGYCLQQYSGKYLSRTTALGRSAT